MPFLNLPNEVIREIIEYLKQEDIYSFIRVNRLLHFIFSEYLLRYNVRHQNGRALTWAVTKGHASLTRKLVELGADVNRQVDLREHEFFRSTLLHIATAKGNLPMVKLLFEIGADPNQRDDKRRAPHYWALVSRNEKMIQEFSWRTENLSQFIVDGSQNRTSLHLAAEFGLTGMIRYFVENGMDVNAKDKEGKTPLDLAKRALCEGHWRRTSDVNDDNAVETMRLLVVLGEDSAAANWFVACNTGGRRRYHCSYGDLDAGLNNHEVRAFESRSGIEHDTNAICLSSIASTNLAFPPLVSPGMDTDSKPQPANRPWSTVGVQRLKTKLSPRDDKRDTLMSGLASPEPFPRLTNESFDQAHDQAVKAWTRFRENKGEVMSVNACMVTRDEMSEAVSRLKAAKPQRKKKWQPVVLEGFQYIATKK